MATVALISIGHINRELESPNGLLNIGNAEGPAYALCQMSVCVCERERARTKEYKLLLGQAAFC